MLLYLEKRNRGVTSKNRATFLLYTLCFKLPVHYLWLRNFSIELWDFELCSTLNWPQDIIFKYYMPLKSGRFLGGYPLVPHILQSERVSFDFDFWETKKILKLFINGKFFVSLHFYRMGALAQVFWVFIYFSFRNQSEQMSFPVLYTYNFSWLFHSCYFWVTYIRKNERRY